MIVLQTEDDLPPGTHVSSVEGEILVFYPDFSIWRVIKQIGQKVLLEEVVQH